MTTKFLEVCFFNTVMNKSELKKLITWAFRNYGIARASNMADKLKNLGFYYATKAGISLSLEDLKIPPIKYYLINDTIKSIEYTDNRYQRGEITAVERFQKIIDTWNEASDKLKNHVIEYFKNTDPLNSIYMMAFSGARANISQVRQLVGMRGLMADPQGQIIDLPISSNFREGLTITDYFISSYGARKGLVDTALRTADSGYLTRRLVDVAQDIIIREYDCKTSKGILLEEMFDNNKILISLNQALLGRVLAEDIIDFSSKTSLAKSGQSINPELLEKIINLGAQNILVRSPLTCSSLRSVCQLCYGWNLAHGKMVDLGEAIGIIAAQSIGEPGTQLTMRTFHTGGVFTGQLSQNIISSYDGYLQYSSSSNMVHTRTKHGDNAMLINTDVTIKIIGPNNKENFIKLLKGSLLLINNDQWVNKGDIIAEYYLNNRLMREKAEKIIVADFSGSVHVTDCYDNNQIINSRLINVAKNNMVIWLLGGQVYNIPNDTKLMISNHQIIIKNSLLARTELLSRHSGRIYLVKNSNTLILPKLLLVTSSKLYINLNVSINVYQEYKRYILIVNNQEKFILKCKPNTKIVHNQVIADMISDSYKTKTGGIIKYLDLSITKNDYQDLDINTDFYDVDGSGYILWIPEETHIINKDISLLLINHGQFIEIGTEIIDNVFASNSGIVEVLEKDGIVREIIIKPGKLFIIDKNKSFENSDKFRGFLRPGETILQKFTADKLTYWEYIYIDQQSFILLRPVIIYFVPKKNLFFKHSDNSFKIDLVNLRLKRRTYFKDGERVKSIAGVNLITSHLILELNKSDIFLKCYMQLEKINNSKSTEPLFFMKFITADFLSIKDSYFSNYNDLYNKTNILVKDNQYVESNSVIAQTNIFSNVNGQVNYIQDEKKSNRRLVIISQSNIRVFDVTNYQNIQVKVNDWVYSGDYLAKDLITNYSGKILSVQENKIILRIGQPYLISSGSFLHVSNNSLVKRGENLATIIFERSKTGDIVQGLPRIEEILEARKKTDISLNPHLMLDAKFKGYLDQGLSIDDSTRLSIMEIQLLLIKEVQLVYQSQGVDIADKHIEVIVKQMTSKVKIENGGDTDYLPGEIVDLQKIESINQSLLLVNKTQASYHPVLLGITKASLNTESFISAASFQETTKVLTDAAISGKLDWLRGLKENVIIGRLIPAGTGFNIYSNSNIRKNSYIVQNNKNLFNINKSIIKHESSDNHFDDIILDDRSNYGYNLSKT
uniref:DNA-directed RNA polymerase subunit beta'' n=1 Tax=Dipterocladia arabiensis TaxID=2007176 RepID=A0A1Z1M0H9_9FLOR|nr:RNA polymerase b''''-subunit [Dipterocladia arabiensis]ARW59382.1 RNA polymerase b''''-subunit [Dipterocladia arabiensis]